MIRKLFKTFYLYPWILVSTMVMGALTIVVTLLVRPADRARHWGHRVAQLWARSILWASGVTVTVIGAEHLAEAEASSRGLQVKREQSEYRKLTGGEILRWRTSKGHNSCREYP